MGIISSARRAGGAVFNFKVTHWVGKDFIVGSFSAITNTFLNIFTPEQAETTETYEESLARLNLTKDDIQERKEEFTKLFLTYIIISASIFTYSLYIAIAYKNIGGFFMGFSITLYALVQSFRYHFWLFQIRNKKLGCSFKDWLMDK